MDRLLNGIAGNISKSMFGFNEKTSMSDAVHAVRRAAKSAFPRKTEPAQLCPSTSGHSTSSKNLGADVIALYRNFKMLEELQIRLADLHHPLAEKSISSSNKHLCTGQRAPVPPPVDQRPRARTPRYQLKWSVHLGATYRIARLCVIAKTVELSKVRHSTCGCQTNLSFLVLSIHKVVFGKPCSPKIEGRHKPQSLVFVPRWRPREHIAIR